MVHCVLEQEDTVGNAVGYARISTPDQDLGLQHDALEGNGCVRVFTDVASGAHETRPELAACLDYLRPDDTLVVWKLDRLGRSVRHLVETVAELDQRGVHVRSLSDGIDTSTSAGRMVAGIFAVLAEHERELIRERTVAGMQAARHRGATIGRPRVMDDDKTAAAIAMRADGASLRAIGEALGVSKATIVRTLRDAAEEVRP